MDILVTLTTAGANIGPTFNLYSDVDNYVTPFVTNVSKASLLSGYYTNLAPINTTIVRVKSMGVDCTNFVTINITPPTTTTTTTYPVTVDFDIEILTNYLYANPCVRTSNYRGGSGQYNISPVWQPTESIANNPYSYSAPGYFPTNYLYFYSGFNQPPTNYGFPPGTYWFGVRDANNYFNMKVKSVIILPPTTSTTSTTTTGIPLYVVVVYTSNTSATPLCVNPTAQPYILAYCTTPTVQANSRLYTTNNTSTPVANGLYVAEPAPIGDPPRPVFKIIDNSGTLAAQTC